MGIYTVVMIGFISLYHYFVKENIIIFLSQESKFLFAKKGNILTEAHAFKYMQSTLNLS